MPTDYSAYNELAIKIDGSPVAADFLGDVVEVVVNLDLHLPGMFSIRVVDSEWKWSGSASIALGKAVEIAIQPRQQGPNETGSKTVLIKGEITALEPEFLVGGTSQLTIRGFDKGHRLHRGKKSRTFLKKKDSDLVSTIAGEVGLSADADATSITYDYILQNNQTNMEFLQERARRIGFWVYVDGVNSKLCFKKPATPDNGQGPTLTWGEDLYRFAPRLSGVHQADKVKVQGWDGKKKEAIVGEYAPAAPKNQGGQSQAGGAAAKSAFGGSAEAIVVNEPVVTVDDAKAVAEGLASQISRNFLWAEGKCFGDPTLVAGAVVTIEIGNAKFKGKYLVTSATHIYNGTEYSTEFTITGQDPYTFSALLGVDPQPPAREPGVVTGLVTNNNDPDKLGRVKVKFPWLNDQVESDWVRLSAPMAGAERGFLTIPEVNDEVLVAFEHGNPDFPYVVGGLWSNTDKPPVGTDKAVSSGKVVQRVFKTRAGHIITLDDSDGAEKISVVDKSAKESIVIDSAAFTITVKSDKTITLEAANGDIVIKGKNVSIESQQNTTIKATQNFEVNATSNATIKATANINVEATAQLGLKGTAGAKMESPAQVEVSSAGMATLKGSMTKIN